MDLGNPYFMELMTVNEWPGGILRTLTNMQKDLLSLSYGKEISVVPYFIDIGIVWRQYKCTPWYH